MAIAKDLGFNVLAIGIFDTTAGRVFIIKRFDLIKGQLARLEDTAQILQIPSEHKYESSNEKVGQVIRRISEIPLIDESIITKQKKEFQNWFNKIEEMVTVCCLSEARKAHSRERLKIFLA